MIEGAPRWFGKRVLNEEEFFTLIQQLRAALPQSLKDVKDRNRTRGTEQSGVLGIIDALEQLVENGKGWMGKKVVEEKLYFEEMLRLRQALPLAMKQAQESASAE